MKKSVFAPFHLYYDTFDGCTSIDNSMDASGYLECCRAIEPGASIHASTSEAVANLLACLQGAPGGTTSIVGHGDQGWVGTGCGQNNTSDVEKFMDITNQTTWQPYLQQLLNNTGHMSFYGCHVGAGDPGADFLFQVALTINNAVAGPTGLVYCNNGVFTFEQGSTWQIATPSQRPPAIQPPTAIQNFNYKLMQVLVGEYLTGINKEQILAIQLRTPELRSLSSKEANSFIRLIDFSNPFAIPGKPAAIVSATFQIALEHGKEQLTKNYIIYNNRLVVDTSDKKTAYHCSTAISAFIK